jgi:hypothetical protein
MITTTLNAIREQSPCSYGWAKLLKNLGKTQADDEPLPFVTILDSNGLDDALWCTRAAPEHNKIWRLYAVWCARQVQHLMTDPRSLATLDIAERHAHGLATDKELAAAERAALNVASVACATAEAAVRAPAWDAANAARAVARSAAANAAEAAARAPAWAAAWAARAVARSAAANAASAAVQDAAWAAAANAACAAAWAAAEDAQIAEFRRIVTETAA